MEPKTSFYAYLTLNQIYFLIEFHLGKWFSWSLGKVQYVRKNESWSWLLCTIWSVVSVAYILLKLLELAFLTERLVLVQQRVVVLIVDLTYKIAQKKSFTYIMLLKYIRL